LIDWLIENIVSESACDRSGMELELNSNVPLHLAVLLESSQEHTITCYLTYGSQDICRSRQLFVELIDTYCND